LGTEIYLWLFDTSDSYDAKPPQLGGAEFIMPSMPVRIKTVLQKQACQNNKQF